MTKHKVFIVEDESDIRELLEHNLRRDGYLVVAVGNGEDAVRQIPVEKPDLILLDLMLPGMDGLEVCRTLKQSPNTANIPIVIVSAKGAESDIVAGLELGADDYVTKPFSINVLIARVRSVLRRRRTTPEGSQSTVHIHELIINPGRHEVLLKGKPVEMTASELRILHFLARHPGWVMTRDQIVDAVRGKDYAVTDRAVDVQIVGIRKKLGKYADYIETVRGVGYRFKE